MGAYADVAIPTGVDKLFTYHIPSDLQTSARIGTRVLVPFGRKWTTGLIVHLPTASSLPSLKSIADVLDPEPVVSPDLLHLCQWIAGYYVAPLAEVLKAALPHGFSSASKRRIHAAVPLDDQTIRDAKKRAPKRAAILSLLQVEGAMWASELQKRVGLKSINAVLNDMVHQGLVRSEEVLPRAKLKAKTHDVLLLHDINAELLSHTLQNLSPRKRKTRELLQAITRWRDQAVEEIAVLDLLKQSKTSSRVFAEAQALCDLPVLKKEIHLHQEYGIEEQTLSIVLNERQEQVLQAITKGIETGVSRTILLHGVTGSGKTQVYIEAIRYCLARGKAAIVLVPEISLTPQIVRRFKSHFGNQALVVHSRMAAGERHEVWRLAREGVCRIIIGPRSAVFAPLHNIGLLIVDEEHESSYKQLTPFPAIMHATWQSCGEGSVEQWWFSGRRRRPLSRTRTRTPVSMSFSKCLSALTARNSLL